MPTQADERGTGVGYNVPQADTGFPYPRHSVSPWCLVGKVPMPSETDTERDNSLSRRASVLLRKEDECSMPGRLCFCLGGELRAEAGSQE